MAHQVGPEPAQPEGGLEAHDLADVNGRGFANPIEARANCPLTGRIDSSNLP